MSKLIIDDKDYGEVSKYKQTGRVISEWTFLMTTGIEIRVPMFIIKRFTSSGDLEIITFGTEAIR